MIKTFDNSNFFQTLRREVLSNNSELIEKRITNIRKNLKFKIFTKNYDANNDLLTLIIVISDMNTNFIEESLSCATKQSLILPEIIFINHGCNQKITNIINRYFKNYPLATLIKLERNIYPILDDEKNSLINLWNLGLFISKGNYVYQLSPDDSISKKYTYFITSHFKSNNKCTSVMPRVLGIDENNKVNKVKSKNYKLDFNDYFTNFELIEKIFSKKDILSPGGAVVTKTTKLIELGGFNLCSDFSQFFLNSCIGINGYSFKAKLLWRHHPNQTNKKETKLGLIRLKIYKEFFSKYGLYEKHVSNLNEDYAKKIKIFYFNFIENKIIDDFRLIYRSSNFLTTVYALREIYKEKNIKILLRCIIILFSDLIFHLYNNYYLLKKTYRFIRSNIYFFSKMSRK